METTDIPPQMTRHRGYRVYRRGYWRISGVQLCTYPVTAGDQPLKDILV